MQLGWIDFSKSERDKIFSVLEFLSEKDTLDELGISPVRDGFSNILFPGTSTIQTRAKYFFLVPYALKELELSNETNPYKVLKKLDEIEKKCGEQLLIENYKEDGIIGGRSLRGGHWVKRTPANIYWAGLRRYGIFKSDRMSLGEYVRYSCAIKAQKKSFKALGNYKDNNDDRDVDDDNAGNIVKTQFWNMPLYNSDWSNNIQMALTAAEASFLKEQIINSCPNTMMSYILENNMIEAIYINSFADLESIIDKFPDDIKNDYYSALSFSNFLFVARTVYNIIISDGQNEEANEEFESLEKELEERASIDIDSILLRLSVNDFRLKSFLKNIQASMISNDIDEIKKLIKNREIFLKDVTRAKTAHPGEIIEWTGGRELDYRFTNAKRIIKDIFEGEGLLDA